MPGEKQGTTFDLKHRLTGAAILIGFAVIVLPLLLGGPEDASVGGGDTAGAEPDTRVFRSNITPIGGPTPPVQEQEPAEMESAEAPPPVDEDAAQPEATAEAGTQEEDAQVASAPSEPAAEPESADQATGRESTGETDSEGGGEPSVAPAETVERGWIVQVGTFRNSDNVEKLVAELQNNGFGTSTTDVETTEGSATRVWVGPYETRVEAARIKTRVKQRVGSEGLIVAYP